MKTFIGPDRFSIISFSRNETWPNENLPSIWSPVRTTPSFREVCTTCLVAVRICFFIHVEPQGRSGLMSILSKPSLYVLRIDCLQTAAPCYLINVSLLGSTKPCSCSLRLKMSRSLPDSDFPRVSLMVFDLSCIDLSDETSLAVCPEIVEAVILAHPATRLRA